MTNEELEYPHYMDEMPEDLKEMWLKLTERQKKFIVYYVQTGNGKRSAVMAGYSKRSAYFQASDNLIKPNIKPIVEWMEAYVIDNALDTSICTVHERMKILSDMARSNIADYTETGDVIDLTAEGANPANVKELTTTTDDQGSLITKIKMYSSVDAIKELNRMEGAYAADKVRHVDKDNNDIVQAAPVVIMTKEMSQEDLDDIGFVDS